MNRVFYGFARFPGKMSKAYAQEAWEYKKFGRKDTKVTLSGCLVGKMHIFLFFFVNCQEFRLPEIIYVGPSQIY